MSPLLCNYYVTLRCNSKCEFCDIWSNDEYKRLSEQNIGELETNLSDLKKLGVKFVDFTGGEPLLYSNIIKALELARHYGIHSGVTTNALLYPKYSRELKGLVKELNFSLDSCDEVEHNSIRGVDSYESVMKSIAIAKDIGQRFFVIHTVTNNNIGKLGNMIDFAQQRNVPMIINPCFEYFGNTDLSIDAMEKLRKSAKEKFVYFDYPRMQMIQEGGNDTGNPMCRSISSSVVISPDNYMLLPCFHKHYKKLKIKGNLYSLYKSREVQKLRKLEGRHNFCDGCTIACCMRAAYLTRNLRYFFLTLKSAFTYIREKYRDWDYFF